MAKLTPQQLKARQRQSNAQAKYDRAQQTANNAVGIPRYGQHKKADWRHSTSDQLVAYPRFEPETELFLNNLLKSLKPGTSNLALPGNNKLSFEPIRNRSIGEFENNAIPSIAERFLQMGSSGARPSDYSGFAQQLANARGGLEGLLASLESEYGLKKGGLESQNLFNLLSSYLQPRSDIGVVGGQNSGLRNAWEGIKGGIPGAVAGGLTGGPSGALYGGLTGLGMGQVSDALQQRNSSNNASGFTSINNPSGFNAQNYNVPSYGNYTGLLNDITRGYGNNLF